MICILNYNNIIELTSVRQFNLIKYLETNIISSLLLYNTVYTVCLTQSHMVISRRGKKKSVI